MKYLFFSLVLLLLIPEKTAAQPYFPGLSGQALIDALADEFRPNSVLSYGDARDELYGDIDRVNDSLYGVYTRFGIAMTPGADPSSDAFSKGINTEHTWPRSKGADNGNPESDMHHLFPTREQVNSARASLPFGEINDNATNQWYYLGFQTSSTPTASIRDFYSELLSNQRFEPREDHKGNVARAMFYFYTVYRQEADAEDPNFFPPQIDDMCNWNALDPVDSRELERTLAIAEFQDGKVNPFVTDCNLVKRAYCPDLSTINCLSSTEEVAPAGLGLVSVIGVGRSSSRQAFVSLSIQEPVRLEVEWLDLLGRKAGFESRDWLGTGTYQLMMTHEVARGIAQSSGPYVARLRITNAEGRSFLKTVLVP
jgi:endonuclease I